MAQPHSPRPLGPVVILASLLVLFGGAAYYVMIGGDDAPPNPPNPPTNPATQATAAAPTSAPATPEENREVVPETEETATPSGPAQAALPVPPASALTLATAPKVTPEERSDAVLDTLDSAKGKFQACTAPWAAENPRATARAFFIFGVSDEGRASNISLQFKGVRDETLDACLRNVLRSLSFDGPAEKVFWPAALGGNSVFEPLSGTAP